MNEYRDKLIKQYANAKGIKTVDLNSKVFLNDFLSWLIERKIMGQTYLELLDDMELKPAINDGIIVEVNKGEYDTLADEDNNIKVITPYTDEIPESKILFPNEFVVLAKKPCIIYSNGLESEIEEIRDNNIDRIITHNPYATYDLRSFETLNHSITIGFWGHVTDKNIDSQYKLAKDIKSKLKGNVKFDFSTKAGAYYFIVSKDEKEKRKIFTKVR